VLTDDARYEAILARDPRFDGVFFVGVQTTGVYCRPICPARTPGRSRCTFYATPAQAEQAGFRPCFRCRPEVAPAAATAPASVDAIDALVTAATQRIHEGALNTGSIDDLAAELGVTARHLRRATEARLGVSPVELAQTRRLALAKQLLQDTALPITSIAFAAGFGSVRRFNAMFAAKMGTAPNEIRRKHASPAGDVIELRLDYRPPYDWARLLGFLRGRAIPGVEKITDVYRRVVHLDGHVGEIVVRPDPRGAQRNERANRPNREVGSAPTPPRSALVLELAPALLPVVMPLVARVRRMFDLDARPDLVDRALARDATLAPLVAARPGLRVPGAIDPFEASIRALLGQQVSVAAATTLAGRFAAQLGTKLGDQELSYRFPTPAEVAKAGAERIVKIGMPMARAHAIHGFARALDRGAIQLDHHVDLDAFVAQLVELPGIGPWTAHYLAMRALHLPDAFPAADLGIQKALDRSGPRDAEARAEAWRPYRSYAVMHLWTHLSEGAAS
jgi:AraC family transcriptional regulator of adaptative response / DNA-3-methyladenine glycosylase II